MDEQITDAPEENVPKEDLEEEYFEEVVAISPKKNRMKSKG